MKRIYDFLNQHLYCGGWKIDLNEAPPTPEQLETYRRQARSRQRAVMLIGLAVVPSLIYVVAATGLGSQPVLGSSLLGPLLFWITVVSQLILVLLLGDMIDHSNDLNPIDDALVNFEKAFKNWKAAVDQFPEVACYQQRLMKTCRDWPVVAEFEAATAWARQIEARKEHAAEQARRARTLATKRAEMKDRIARQMERHPDIACD